MDAERSTKPDITETPVEALELKAMHERGKLHHSIEELKEHYAAAREKLDVRNNARQHILGASIAVATLGLLSGYAIAGSFTRH